MVLNCGAHTADKVKQRKPLKMLVKSGFFPLCVFHLNSCVTNSQVREQQLSIIVTAQNLPVVEQKRPLQMDAVRKKALNMTKN